MDTKISALDRGINIIEAMIFKGIPCSYSELKQISGVPHDAAMSRLLKALTASGVIVKNSDSLYELTDRVLNWGRELKRDDNHKEFITSQVDLLASTIKESTGFIWLHDDCIEVVASCMYPESIYIISPGEFFALQADHAAVVAILAQLPEEKVKNILPLSFSRIEKYSEVQKAVAACQCADFPDVFVDRSQQRPGISRCAAAVRIGNKIGAVFACLTSEVLFNKLNYFTENVHESGLTINKCLN